jgi:hypothetical protein
VDNSLGSKPVENHPRLSDPLASLHGMDKNTDKKTKQPYRPLIRTQAELELAWRHLMEPLGFAARSLWLMVIDDDDRPIPHLTELTDLTEMPDSRSAGDLAELVRIVSEALPQARLAFLLSRPDTGPPESPDRAWAAVLYDAARGAGAVCAVVHLATDDGVTPIPWDALARRRRVRRSAGRSA